jgi:uncharacterized tellurite resistance protein B-like protein
MKVRDRIGVLVDLFLGAAHADHRLDSAETPAVRALLAELLLTEELPDEVETRIEAFDPAAFDLAASAADFAADPPMQKRRLLELVGRICHSDDVLDLEEDAFMRQLARHLGMDEDEYGDLVLDYEIDDLRQSFSDLRRPPPVPT